jgi:putative restriction endonuclease
MERGTPLIYFYGIVEGKYLAIWPVFVVGDAPDNLTFKTCSR